jgi:hypothetical protein
MRRIDERRVISTETHFIKRAAGYIISALKGMNKI